jgi:hypothetical protein
MPEATSNHTTVPTRRRFLSQGAAVAAGGTILALAPLSATEGAAAPASPLDAANASPALRAAVRALGDAHDRLKEARATFDAADRLPEEWRGSNPRPADRRAIKRWNRREREYRYSVTMPPWQAVIAAEDDFREAKMAVAKIDARDMGELALKACLSAVFDAVHLTYPNAAEIGFSVALNLVSLTVQS